jgi:hypothetical protein
MLMIREKVSRACKLHYDQGKGMVSSKVDKKVKKGEEGKRGKSQCF